jgi:oligopeptide/dipeptide ABC transporter ATP-binding protein
LDLAQHRLASIEGQVPSPMQRPAGCGFAPRCPFAQERCYSQAPELQTVGLDHTSACWRAPLDPMALLATEEAAA